jgi:hypothetical protein
MSNRGKVWSSKKIAEEVVRIDAGLPADYAPFFDGNTVMRAGDIVFEYSQEEIEEMAKCANDVVYFGEKYCFSMTDEGIRRITLRDYQKEMLKNFQENRFNVMLASRQIGKTVTSSIFIAWYLCFHYDRNVMVVANKLATTNEIVDKIKTILKNLPFFMKPGTVSGGVTGMKFDNGNRLFSQATTKTAAIGFTIHLLYADEFAHIHNNFLSSFYRSIYPTLSSSKISRIIISSTPNGMNLFHEIYQGALEGKNAYHSIRVDWWQVPGRDDNWKRQEIANLGSEELFNQEYGNQFLASSRLLLPSSTLHYMKRISKKYKWKEIDDFIDYSELSEAITWHPDYDPTSSAAKKESIVFVVDIGDGVGRDYSVINIMKLEPKSPAMIRKTKNWNDESSFFRLKQVGMFRSNVLSVEDMSKALEILVFDVYQPERIKIVMEINFKGNLVFERLSKNREFYPEIFLYTKHSMANDTLKLGVKIQKDNKESYARELRNLIQLRKIVVNEYKTFEELSSFGINNAGRYEAQTGNDDTAMTCVNLVPFFDSTDFYEMVEDVYDSVNQYVISAVEKRMSAGDANEEGLSDLFQVIKDIDNKAQSFQPKYPGMRVSKKGKLGNY